MFTPKLPLADPAHRPSTLVRVVHWTIAAALLLATTVTAQQQPAAGLWTDVEQRALGVSELARRIPSNRYRAVVMDRDRLETILATAPHESTFDQRQNDTLLSLPWPDGGTRYFRIEESPIMEPGLAAQFPELKTYRGQGLDDPTASVRFDWTPSGFHAMVLSADGTVYIDPFTSGDIAHYLSYFRRDYQRTDGGSFTCGVTAEQAAQETDRRDRGDFLLNQAANGTQLRTYRLALAATGEYTAFFGGTVSGAMNGMVTTMNRVNGIYERDLAVHMNIIAGDAALVYTNAATDPYTNSNGTTMLSQNQSNITSVIGSANYDIGHVFSTGGGGIAQIAAVCSSTLKAQGVTGSPSPTSDAFDVDYVAHEMGHQFGANHPFNGTTSNCGGGNRNAGTAYEPGSGSTVMAYAGICGAEDLQPHSDAYFHAISQQEIVTFISGAGNSCAAVTSTGNTPPSVNAGADFTIPMGTPFTLTATGSDVNGDSLTYAWEEFDLGTASPPNTDNGNRPIFRSYAPTSSPSRTFPSLTYVLNNANAPPATIACSEGACLTGESMPTTTRAMTFRVTARDNRANGGGTASDDMVLNVTATSGPFVVTQPNTAVSWVGGSQQTITWNVANTTASPVSAANVKISLSTDGGLTFPTVLAASTPNNGSASLTVPNVPTTTARVKVEAVGNVFFDVSDLNFTITAAATVPVFTSPSTGATLASSAIFSWTAGAGTQYQLYLGTSLGATDLARISTGSTLSASAAGLPRNGQTVYARLWYLLPSGWSFIDTTFATENVPVLTGPAVGARLIPGAATFTWTAGSASQYQLYLGSSLGNSDLGHVLAGTSLTTTITNLPANGQTVFVRLWSLVQSGWTSVDYSFATENVPVLASPVQGALLVPGAATFTWTAGSASQYQLYLGSSVGNSDFGRVLTGANLTATITNLPANGQTVYVRLWSLVQSGWTSVDYTFATVNMPVLITPIAGTVLAEGSVSFTWTAGSASQYQLYLGSTPGMADFARLQPGANTSAIARGLPTNGPPVYARLWTLFPTGWASTDYTFATTNATAAVMTSPAQGETIEARSVLFSWTRGQASQYQLYLGSTPGLADIARIQAGTNLSAVVSGLPTNGQTVYARLWSLLPAGWTPTDYSFATVNTSAAVLTSPAQDATVVERSVQFTWTSSAATSYQVYVGSTPGAQDFGHVAAGGSLSATLTNLPADGRTIYVRLWSLLSGGWTPVDYMFGTIDATGVALTAPAQSATPTSGSASFSWTAGSASQFQLYVGRTQGGNDIARVQAGSQLSATVTGLPIAGTTIYVRLWYLLSGGWTFVDYTFVTG